MDIFTMLVVGQVVGAAMVLVGGWGALVFAGKLREMDRRGEDEMRGVAENLLEHGEFGMIESGLPGFGIEVGRSNDAGEFMMRVLGRQGGDGEMVEVMRVDGRFSLEDGFSVRLPGSDWLPVEDPVVWAIGYCARHKDDLMAAVEASK